MPSKSKVTPDQTELPEVFNNHEFSSPADRLIEAVKQHYSRIEGYNVDTDTLREVVNKILEKRL